MPGKVVVLVSSGKDQKPKVLTALTLAAVGKQNKLFDDLRVIFFGPSEELVAERDPDVMKLLDQLNSAGEKPLACQVVAQSFGLTDALKTVTSIQLTMVGPVIAELAGRGYEFLTF
jgi:hypothetical protein